MTNDPSPSDHPAGTGRSRRQVLFAGAGAVASVILTACGGGDSESATATPDTTTGGPPTTAGTQTGAATATTLAPTPTCDDGDDPTPAQTDGPFFKANSPEQADLRPGAGGGTALNLSGVVVTTGCQPVNAAKMEFWQTDDGGAYDNSGYRLRGHQFTDAQGRYALQTIVPGRYPGRTRHIHVLVQAPNGKLLTTQLYFPGESQNASDGFYRAECLIDVKDTASGKDGTFTFVLNG